MLSFAILHVQITLDHDRFLTSAIICNLVIRRNNLVLTFSLYKANTEKFLMSDLLILFSKEFLAGNESFIQDKRFHPYRLEKETGFFFYLIKVENWSLRQHPLLSCCPPFCCHRKSLLKTPMFFRSSEDRSLDIKNQHRFPTVEHWQ